MIDPKQVLVLAPHPDDAELGLGATMAKFSDAGVAVTVLMLSDRDEPKQWMNEALQAAKVLGDKVAVQTLHHTVFHMAEQRQAILRAFEAYRNKLEPDVVFAPATGDAHQDHAVAMAEARRVFQGTTLLGYEIIRSNKGFRPTLFLPVTLDHVDRKVKAVQRYKTQRGKDYCQREAIEGLARVRGAQCDSPTWLAESFEVEWAIA